MEMTTYFISIIFFSSALFSFVDSQEDNCTSNINLNGVLPFDTISFRSHPIWPAQDFILRYLQTSPRLWTFDLSSPSSNSYVAIGFSGNGRMVGSSAMVGWMSAAGKGVLKQYYLGGTKSDQVISDQGSLKVVNSSMLIVSNSSRLYIAFQWNTMQPESSLIYAVGQTKKTPTSANILAQHKDQVSTLLNYASALFICTPNAVRKNPLILISSPKTSVSGQASAKPSASDRRRQKTSVQLYKGVFNK